MVEYRKIIHIDMDAFFASVEQRDNLRLVGKPIAVGYDGPRGVVSTASYEARRYGVHSAMSMAMAKRLCPHLIIVPCHFDLYKQISAEVREIFHEYTDVVEPLSLDEAFLDVTVNKKGLALAQDIALEIKDKIYRQLRLTASAGVSYNKFLAKIASDFHKPNGLTVVHPLRALDFIAKLPIEDFWGVGPKTAEKMHGLGIYDGAQLRAQSLDTLTVNFGKSGRIYYDFARGIDDRPVQPVRLRKSVGCEETFLSDIWQPRDVMAEIETLVDELTSRIDRHHFEGHTLTLKVKYFNFTQITRSLSRDDYFKDASEIRHAAFELLQLVDYSEDRPIRLLGLTVSNPTIEDSRPVYPTLFDDL